MIKIEKFRIAAGKKDITTSRNRPESEQQVTRLSEKKYWNFETLMKILEQMTSRGKYLEEREVQGTSKRVRTSVECHANNNIDLASRTSTK